MEMTIHSKNHELNQLFNAKNMRRTNADNNDN